MGRSFFQQNPFCGWWNFSYENNTDPKRWGTAKEPPENTYPNGKGVGRVPSTQTSNVLSEFGRIFEKWCGLEEFTFSIHAGGFLIFRHVRVGSFSILNNNSVKHMTFDP